MKPVKLLIIILFISTMQLFATDTIPGTTLEFDGIDDNVSCGNNISLDMTNQITIEAWINANSWKAEIWRGTIVGKDNPDQTGFNLRCGANGSLSFVNGISGSWSETQSSEIMSTNEWYHVAGVYDGVSQKIYINGELVGENPVTGVIGINTLDLKIGDSPGYADRYFDGKIDEVRVWNIARTDQEIRESMYTPLDGTNTGLISNWQFNEGTGTSLSDAIGISDGTLNNMDEEDWVSSTFPFGTGISFTHIVNSTGSYNFTGTDVSMNITGFSSTDTLVVKRISAAPNEIPSDVDYVFDSQYWVMNNYGSGVNTAQITFTVSEDIESKYEGSPEFFKLYGRTANSDSSWTYVSDGVSVDISNDIVTFSAVSTFQQYIVSHNNKIVIDNFSGTALEFDGVNDYVTCTGIDTTMTAISIEAWVKHNQLTPGTIQRYVTVSPEVAGIRYDNIGGGYNSLHFYVRGSSGSLYHLRCDSVLTTGEWMHIAGTYDGNVMKLYHNGRLLSQAIVNDGLYTLDSNFELSKSDEALNGCIDEVRIWSTARTDSMIRESMYGVFNGTEIGLESYWQFNEGSGTLLHFVVSGISFCILHNLNLMILF